MPSSYINSDNIGNCYLNRLDGSVLQGEPIEFKGSPNSGLTADAWREFFTVKFGDDRTIWTPSATTGSLSFISTRFPVSWETLTGNIAAPGGGAPSANARVLFTLGANGCPLNASNGTTVVNVAGSGSGGTWPYCFAVMNDYALAWCAFTNITRTTSLFGYVGWLRNDSGGSGGRYTNTQFPRNLCGFGIGSSQTTTWYNNLNVNLNQVMRRVATENSSAAQTLYTVNDTTWNPAINCTGDSTPLILRDSVSPFNRVGMTYHLFRIPSSCVIGQVYKLGSDPDGSNKPYVICCGTWGTDFKVGMRVWADGYT